MGVVFLLLRVLVSRLEVAFVWQVVPGIRPVAAYLLLATPQL
jgi:hypothetical protein